MNYQQGPERKTTNICNVKFGELNIPLVRRRQTLGILMHLNIIPIFCAVLTILCLFNTQLFRLLILYLLWVFIDNIFYKTPDVSSRGKYNYFRNFRQFKWFGDQFPADLIVEEKLDPSENYMFISHPHGLYSMSLWANMANNSRDIVNKLGFCVHACTLNLIFYLPFYRDQFMNLGAISVSKESINFRLSNKNKEDNQKYFEKTKFSKGSLLIVLGGAEESLKSVPYTNDIIIRKRKGFMKQAIKNGCQIVPVFNFGENDLFNIQSPLKDSFLSNLQKYIKKLFSFTIPLVYGRGIFNQNVGFLPYRHPLTTVIGKPWYIEKQHNQDDIHLIDEHIEIQINKLTELFEKQRCPQKI